MTTDETRLTQLLLDNDQTHLFDGWKAGEEVEKKHKFFEQVRGLESGYPGGVAAYLNNARNLLKSSAAGDNPFEGMKPEVPSGVKLEYGTPAFVAAEERGVDLFGESAFVLVAGGLGERLGYPGIKVSLPVELTTSTCYLQLYAEQILAAQAVCSARRGSPVTIPLAIMTSDDTHARTVDLLASHDNFGLAPGQVSIIKQEKVAALLDNDAHIAVSETDVYEIDTKPHGHGDVHTLLASSGLAKKWVDEGRKYLVFFQDTNSLFFTVTAATIGVSDLEGFEVNSVTVARKAKDAVGAITRLVKADGTSITVNVEYNQLEPLLKASGFPEGDVNDATGYSPFPGNINQLVFRLEPYVAVLERTGGLVPEFVNPKYADAAKNKFKKPTRLECMMQDHPKVLGPGARVGFTNFPDWTYSPVKNSIDEARSKIAVGAPGRSACEGELEYYASFFKQTEGLGLVAPPTRDLEVFGFKLANPAHVVLHPSVAVTYKALTAVFPSPPAISISSKSTLVLEGPNLVIESLTLDGTLVIKAIPGAKVTVKKLSVANAGWELVPLSSPEDDAAPASTKIRGFKLVKHDAKLFEFLTPGDYTIDE